MVQRYLALLYLLGFQQNKNSTGGCGGPQGSLVLSVWIYCLVIKVKAALQHLQHMADIFRAENSRMNPESSCGSEWRRFKHENEAPVCCLFWRGGGSL